MSSGIKGNITITNYAYYGNDQHRAGPGCSATLDKKLPPYKNRPSKQNDTKKIYFQHVEIKFTLGSE
jgi:hypothetical protein